LFRQLIAADRIRARSPEARRLPRPSRLLLLVVAALAAPSAAPSTAAAACPVAAPASCFGVRVPLDRSGAVPGTITLRAARIRSRRASRPPLVGLLGNHVGTLRSLVAVAGFASAGVLLSGVVAQRPDAAAG